MAYYGTITEADTYFSERLHSESWDDASTIDKTKALKQSTKIIDQLNYKGVKAAVYDVLYDADNELLSPVPTETEILAAAATQELEFPRGADSDVPITIEYAAYEIAFSLLDGIDPELELQSLRVRQQKYAVVQTTYADTADNVEYLLYGVPSSIAWRWLLPYLDNDQSIFLSRVN